MCKMGKYLLGGDIMEKAMELINRKFLKDYELMILEDFDVVKSCTYLRPYNAHYKEYLVK